jgi:hypothetical protein
MADILTAAEREIAAEVSSIAGTKMFILSLQHEFW